MVLLLYRVGFESASLEAYKADGNRESEGWDGK